MAELTSIKTVLTALRQRPRAVARLFGSSEYPNLSGWVYFYQMKRGVLVAAEVTGLPLPDKGQERMFGFHIHGGAWCSGTQDDPFADTLTHYDPQGDLHPYPAGDLPPLFGNQGYAMQVVFTDRFSVSEILHRTVIVHSLPDDFTSQPGGNAGKKIACGRVEAYGGY